MTSTDRRPVTRPEAGFTLIELMVALVVISIGILALSAVQTRSSGDVYKTGRQARALALAQDRIETKRAGGFDAAASDTGQSGPFLWTANVTDAGLDLKQVTVNVTWTEGGSDRSLQFQTLLSKR